MAQDSKQSDKPSMGSAYQPSFKVDLVKSSLDDVKSDVLVVFTSQVASVSSKSSKPKPDSKSNKSSQTGVTVHLERAPKALHGKIGAAASRGSITGTAQEVVLFRDTELSGAHHLIVVGLGDAKELTAEALRQAAAGALTQIKSAKAKSAAIAVDSLPRTKLPAEQTTQALCEGLLLAGYAFNEYKTDKKKDDSLERLTLVYSQKTKGHETGLEAARAISDCVNFSRWLGDRPGNRMTPSILADETVRAAKGTKLKVNVWDKARIKTEKMGSFLSVSLGSSQEPRFIVMEYNGGPSSKPPICYVGKGLTFDSGGISIKPSAGMEEMKYDMCGGAAVIGTMLAIARLRLKINAIGLVPATENMPGPAANKPGDIVTARNGKTIEINNTDAEGRLILNDALVYACEQKPSVIFDIATLTGAMAVALGNLHTGFFTRHDRLSAKIDAAAKISGEWVWRMPLTDLHAKDMKGTYADLSNISSGKGAGSATAAAFLEQFVDKDIPWAHFDIAGTAWHTGDRVPYNPRKGASGAMVRTFIQFAMNEA